MSVAQLLGQRLQRGSRLAAGGDARPAHLEVRRLSVGYGSGTVVRDVSLDARPGQVVCILGRNGAGKTTLLNAIVGIHSTPRESVFLDGRDASRSPAYDRARAGIGYVPQGRRIFGHLTVLENLLVGLASQGGRDTGQLAEVYSLFPVLREMSSRAAGVLSGGQQQQLAIARALMGRPRVLLLDEPTEGLQPNIVQQIEEVIGTLRGRMTIVLVEQFQDFALANADHCYVMGTGEVVLEGAPADLGADALRAHLAV